MKEIITTNKTYIPDILASMAVNSFNIDVSSKTASDWGIVSSACGIADDQIDNTRDLNKRRAIMHDGVSYIQGTKDTLDAPQSDYLQRMAKLRDLVSQLPKERQDDFIRHLRIFCHVTEKIRRETNASKASTLKRVEAQTASRLYMDVSPDEVRLAPQFQDFQKTFARVSRVANTIDTCIDLPDDFEHERTLVQPTLLNRLVFLKDAFYDATKTLGVINKPFLFKVATLSVREFLKRKTVLPKEI